MKLDNYTKKIKDKILFIKVNFIIDHKKIILNGAVGSGKTTIINDFYFKYPFYSYFTQEMTLFPKEKVSDLFLLFNINKSNSFLLKRLFIEDLINKKFKYLSSGEQDRIKLYIAMSIANKFIILDEPCSHLDEKNTHNIFNLLEDDKKNYLVISHKFIGDDFWKVYTVKNFNLCESYTNKRPITDIYTKPKYNSSRYFKMFFLKQGKVIYFLLLLLIICFTMIGNAYIENKIKINYEEYKQNPYSKQYIGNIYLNQDKTYDYPTINDNNNFGKAYFNLTNLFNYSDGFYVNNKLIDNSLYIDQKIPYNPNKISVKLPKKYNQETNIDFKILNRSIKYNGENYNMFCNLDVEVIGYNDIDVITYNYDNLFSILNQKLLYPGAINNIINTNKFEDSKGLFVSLNSVFILNSVASLDSENTINFSNYSFKGINYYKSNSLIKNIIYKNNKTLLINIAILVTVLILILINFSYIVFFNGNYKIYLNIDKLLNRKLSYICNYYYIFLFSAYLLLTIYFVNIKI